MLARIKIGTGFMGSCCDKSNYIFFWVNPCGAGGSIWTSDLEKLLFSELIGLTGGSLENRHVEDNDGDLVWLVTFQRKEKILSEPFMWYFKLRLHDSGQQELGNRIVIKRIALLGHLILVSWCWKSKSIIIKKITASLAQNLSESVFLESVVQR